MKILVVSVKGSFDIEVCDTRNHECLEIEIDSPFERKTVIKSWGGDLPGVCNDPTFNFHEICEKYREEALDRAMGRCPKCGGGRISPNLVPATTLTNRKCEDSFHD